jgi:ABC-type nitrate/sulfonate/bicarbonate transport system substrate-binding protein
VSHRATFVRLAALVAFAVVACGRPPVARADASAASAVAAPVTAPGKLRGTTHLKVLVPDGDNLQYLSFWVAQGAGYVADEGLDVELVIPELPAQAIAKMLAGDAPVAVLPPPVYLQLIADRFPIELVANLLQNDPIDLVVRRSVFDARKMNASAPLRDRLLSLKGLRVGIAPNPPVRLRALFASEGLDADAVVKLVIRHGKDQNAAFAHDDCDALYAHTPFLEQAIDDQDAVVLVNQSGGDAPALAMRQIHAIVARREFLETDRPVVDALVRAVARAEQLVHADRAAAEAAILRALPSLDARHVHTIVGLYQAAVPETPRVRVEGLAPALALFPANRRAPSLDGVPLAEFVAGGVLDEANRASPGALLTTPAPSPGTPPARISASPSSRLRGLIALAGALLVAGALVLARVRRRVARDGG